MELTYFLLDPTRNMTLLVESPVPSSQQPLYAARLMEQEPTAEQVGFLSPGAAGYDIAMRMAGGEFCGNATMSAAALFAMEHGVLQDRVTVLASGTHTPVPVEVTCLPDGSCRGTVTMPRPLSVDSALLELDGVSRTFPVVHFPGIAHVISDVPIPKEQAEQAVKKWCTALHTESLGLMLLDLPRQQLTPIVYVPAADTLFWESSCASGTAAVGAYLAARTGAPISVSLAEPGGSLSVQAAPNGAIYLTGTVRLVRKKTVTLSPGFDEL